MKEVKEVVHVPTRQLAEEVLRVAKENGLMEVIGIEDWEVYKTETYFIPSKYGGFGSLSLAKRIGYTIIIAEEFLNRYKNSELDRLRKENAQLKKQLKEIKDQPKVGDVCLFWEPHCKWSVLGVLDRISINGGNKGYYSEDIEYEYCVKATDENIQAKIKELKNE